LLITPELLDLISIAYGVYAIVTLYNVVRNRASLFDRQVTQEDARLASAFAFSFLWPPAVLLHEAGHWIVAQQFGARDIRLHFFFYWGEISYAPGLSYRQEWWVALAGNVVTYALGFAGFAAARLPRRSPIWRVILFSFASNQLFVVLFWYPALCLFRAFYGDFTVIYGYGTPYWWAGAEVVAAVNIATLLAYGWANYTDQGKAWLRAYLWGARAGGHREIESQKAETGKDGAE
jgi:hypothetical protein